VSGDDEVVLLHIVKSESKQDEANEKLQAVVNGLADDQKSRVSYKVVVGKLFEDINSVGEEINATKIIMGTHGAGGLQKILGSNALKVVNSSGIPFLITQETKDYNEINRIVMPFSYDKETIQVVQFATALAQKYDACIDLIGFRDKDEWLAKDMKVNEAIMRRALTDEKVEHSIVALPGKKSYEKELMDYAKESGADLFAAAYMSDSIIPSYGKGAFLQMLITNEHNIPVLTINAQTLTKFSGAIVY